MNGLLYTLDMDAPVNSNIVAKPSNTSNKIVPINEPANESKEKKTEEDGDSEEDIEPVDVLLQFIPYYGQGDPSNDSIVRATLSALSVEDIDSKDEYGNTLLLLACQYRCEDLVRIMLNKGADPNAVNSSGACCLHFACYRESASYTVAKVLLQNGANPDVAETTFGCTPLHYCAGTGDIKFCKLLLSYGAMITSKDFYNYTCVDYAREAGMTEVCSYLQLHFDKAMQAKQTRSKNNNMNDSSSNLKLEIDKANWEAHTDPTTGQKYYTNVKTGECLWENELNEKLINNVGSPTPTSTESPSKTPKRPPPKKTDPALIAQAINTILVSFLSKHDPVRLGEVDSLSSQYKGKETELVKDLCAKYNISQDSDPDMIAMHVKLQELKGVSAVEEESTTPVDVRKLINEAVEEEREIQKKKLEAAIEEERKEHSKNIENRIEEERRQLKKLYETRGDMSEGELRKSYETKLEEERSTFRTTLSEKEGIVAKLQSEVEAIEKQKESLAEDLKEIQMKFESVHQSGGQALIEASEELNKLREEWSQLKTQNGNLQQDLHYSQEKLTSLEATMTNLTSGHEDKIALERAAAEERAQQMKEREEKFNQSVLELETKNKNLEIRMKTEFVAAKNDWTNKEKQMKDEFEQIKKSKEAEINQLRKELADRKAQFATEISSAQMEMMDLKRTVEESNARAEDAVSQNKSAQNEIAELKQYREYNAQLHKDLQREQVARKKLHNEMEDLKGKIRVYVRIRPFSKSEREKNCQEAVLKDGKMSVMVKGIGAPDNKKFFEFDSVFGGVEGNTQEDVFKDTKHLMLSVIDGYNVCIFAYGQTGAGKSFTMIGAADIGNCMTESGEFDTLAGITPRAVSEIFRLLNERSAQVEFIVEVQMFQLYKDGLEDLLKDKKKKNKNDNGDDEKEKPLKITLAEHSPTGLVIVEGAETMTAKSAGDVMKIFAKGSSRRTTASTQMNAESSRSHLICSLVVKLTNRNSGTQTSGKLTLVDLAGSERVDKSGAQGDMLKEAQSINKSLSALGDVISALTTGQSHVPYRNHPLTMVMSDSIGGNAKTLMFVNTSPADYNNSESNSSLQFASRCKDITNNVQKGGGGSAVNAAEVNKLKKELANLKKNAGGGSASQPNPLGATLSRPDTSKGGRQ